MIDILDFVHSFLPLINSHSNDFLIIDLWNNFLPDEIRLALDSIENPENILHQYIHYTDVALPFDSKDIKANINWNDLIDPDDYIINRKLLPKWEIVSNDLDYYIKTCANFARFKSFTDVKTKFVDDVFLDHGMKIKKSYEVEKMSSLCHDVCNRYNIRNIVDIGSGKGYLGTDLSVSKGFNVIELDSKESNSEGAHKRRQRFQLQLPNMKKKQNVDDRIVVGNCRSIVRNITQTDTIGRILIEEGCDCENYLLTGLHCCGGLSSTVLRNFIKNPDSKAVTIVGCCYHLLQEKFIKNFPKDQMGIWDFPLSSRLENAGILLGRNAKSFASQSVRRIINQPQLPSSMFHRILLQRLLFDKLGYVSDDWIVGKIGKKLTDVDNFQQYARLACDKLGFKPIVDSMSAEDFQRFENQFPRLRHRFSCFFYLKCCMATIIENVIIWDRLMFLEENGIANAQVLELFDEVKSPRRYALVGVK